MQVEDFEGGPDGGFNNPVFTHEVLASETTQLGPLYEFSASDSVSPEHSLRLFPATDYIRFNLDQGEFVDYAEVWMAGTFVIPSAPDGSRGEGERIYPALFRVIGRDELGLRLDVTYHVPLIMSEDWHFFSTAGAHFGEINEIRLTGVKSGTFDDLAVNVTPEPATLGLLALGLVGLFRHRPRRQRAPRHP